MFNIQVLSIFITVNLSFTCLPLARFANSMVTTDICVDRLNNIYYHTLTYATFLVMKGYVLCLFLYELGKEHISNFSRLQPCVFR